MPIHYLGSEYFTGCGFGECRYDLYDAYDNDKQWYQTPNLAVWLHGGDHGDISKADLHTMQWRMGCRTIWMVPKSPKPSNRWIFQWGLAHGKEDDKHDLGFVWGHLHRGFLSAFADHLMTLSVRFQAERVLAFGYSMGGFGSYQIASWAPEVFDAVIALAGYGVGTQDPEDQRFHAPQPESGRRFQKFLETYAVRMAKVPIVFGVHAKSDSLASYEDDAKIIGAVSWSAWKQGFRQQQAALITVPENLANSDPGYSRSGHNYYKCSLLTKESEWILWSRLRTALKKAPKRLFQPAGKRPNEARQYGRARQSCRARTVRR